MTFAMKADMQGCQLAGLGRSNLRYSEKERRLKIVAG